MTKQIISFTLLLLTGIFSLQAADSKPIRIGTNDIDLILKIGDNGRLYQSYLGERLQSEADIAFLKQGKEVYLTHGLEDYFEPAIRVLHNDGNPSLLLKYVSHENRKIDDNVTETVITLQDDKYPVEVKLFFTTFAKENIIKERTEIKHQEKKPITLYNYASSLLHLNADHYWLTEFSGEWAHEANMTERQLDFGKKIIDTKLGVRANMFCSPFFFLSLNQPARENEGDILMGTIGWTGNFRFTFEVDNLNGLRIISGINPHASEYSLKPKTVFSTPEFIFTYSTAGTGEATRNFHNWARKYQI